MVTLRPMLAAVVDGPGEVAVRDVPAPAPGGWAMVRVARAGLCGTDLKIADGDVAVRPGRILGHEIVGHLETAASDGSFEAGSRVLVNPAVYCGRCEPCRRDLPQLCRDGALLGRDADGGFAEYVAVPWECLHRLPDECSDEQAVLLQVLSTCVHAQSGTSLAPDGTAVVVGLGVSGLLHVQLLRARGVSTIVGVTRSAWKRELAREFGATAVAEPDAARDVVAEATAGAGADLAIECAGTPRTLAAAMRLVGPGGTVVVFGITTPEADHMPTYEWYLKELTILNRRAARPRDCATAIRMSARGLLDLAPLVTARYPVRRLDKAIAACRDATQLKVVLDVA